MRRDIPTVDGILPKLLGEAMDEICQSPSARSHFRPYDALHAVAETPRGYSEGPFYAATSARACRRILQKLDQRSYTLSEVRPRILRRAKGSYAFEMDLGLLGRRSSGTTGPRSDFWSIQTQEFEHSILCNPRLLWPSADARFPLADVYYSLVQSCRAF